MDTVKIGFLSFRISGNDGVSLEAVRWKKVLERMGHEVTFIAGELDQKGVLLPNLHFTNPHIYRIHEAVIKNHRNRKEIEKKIFSWAGRIEGELREVFKSYSFKKLMVANVFSLPMHIPFSIALKRVITEFKIPTISRNHDFWWERPRYLKSEYFEFFKNYFPPKNPIITHITINKIAQNQMQEKTGLKSKVIGDSFDFKSSLSKLDPFSRSWRKDFKIKKNNLVFLQPTRIVPRKKIELSIELVKRLNDERIVLVLAGDPSDEGLDYAWELKHLAHEQQVEIQFIGHRVNSKRKIVEGKRIYTLWDCFANCDFVTYPSKIEGFGNQFIEAVYFKKPILVNRYKVYKSDLEPLGFEVVGINNKLTENAVRKVKEIINDQELTKKITEKNFEIGKKHFSFEALRKKLEKLGL